MACLDDPTVLRFVTGRLDELAHRRAEEELARCSRCAALVAELIRDQSVAHRGGKTGAARAETSDESGERAAARYLLGQRIARGGMGTILAAYDRQLDRSVAIK